MAVPSETFRSFSAIGNREDLSDVIYNTDPTDTPLVSSIPRTNSSASLHEWQTDVLDAASDSNFVEEGDDATTDATVATVRLTNRNCISDKVPRVSGTQQAVNKAGRRDELAYQVTLKAMSLKRDIESVLTANNIAVAPADGTPPECTGVEPWIATNGFVGTGGTVGEGQTPTARTDGTNRNFTEQLLKAALLSIWNAGGDPDCIMLSGALKQTVSGFTGNATRFKTAEDRKLVTTISLYESDFGDLQIKPNRFMVQETCLILQTDMWALAELRPMGISRLAKTGDSERRQILTEYTLEARNEKASGAVFDLT